MYKLRLCAHGEQQQWGINYWEMYAPVVNLTSVCFLLIMAQLLKLYSQTIDFVLVLPQSDLKIPAETQS